MNTDNNRQRQQTPTLTLLDRLIEAARQRSDYDDDVFFGFAEHRDDPIEALREFALGRHRDGERTLLKAMREAAADLLVKALGEVIEPSKLAAFEGGDGSFPITSVHRDDLEEAGYDASLVNDETMTDIADMMANAYCEGGGFWDGLESAAEALDILGKPDDDETDGAQSLSINPIE